MRVAVITLLTLAALAAAQRSPAAGDTPGPVKASSLAPRPAPPGRVYGAPIDGPILLHKHVRKKPPAANAPIPAA
jgi:hypothetical protein